MAGRPVAPKENNKAQYVCWYTHFLSNAPPPTFLSLPPPNSVMASGGGDALVSIWDLSSVACVRTLTRMDGPIRDLSLSKDGQYVAYGTEPLPAVDTTVLQSIKGIVEIASIRTGETLATYSSRWDLDLDLGQGALQQASGSLRLCVSVALCLSRRCWGGA